MYFTPEDEIKGYWYVNPVTRFPDFIVGMLLFHLYNFFKNKHITSRQGSAMEIISVLFFCLSIFLLLKFLKYTDIPVTIGYPSLWY